MYNIKYNEKGGRMMTNLMIKNILIEKRIYALYHANTVLTSCTFLEYGALLSRELVEKYGLRQTEQYSDHQDKILGVYGDLFFDSVDIANRIKAPNLYGPVVFEYSIDFIDGLQSDDIRITRDNPVHWWTGMNANKKYFYTEEELRREYRLGEFKQHFTVKNQSKGLGFKYLRRIILDDPGEKYQDIFNRAKERIEQFLYMNATNVRLEIRDVKRIQDEYATRSQDKIEKLFGV